MRVADAVCIGHRHTAPALFIKVFSQIVPGSGNAFIESSAVGYALIQQVNGMGQDLQRDFPLALSGFEQSHGLIGDLHVVIELFKLRVDTAELGTKEGAGDAELPYIAVTLVTFWRAIRDPNPGPLGPQIGFLLFMTSLNLRKCLISCGFQSLDLS